MKQTFFLMVISFLVLSSCSSLNNIEKIETFEKTIGFENSIILTDYVLAFEKQVLKAKYPSLTTEKAYLKLLSENPYSIAPMKLYNLFSNYNLDQYFESQLWHEIYAPVDSLWIENHQLNVRFVYLSEDGKKEVGGREGISVKGVDKDSVINDELRICYFNPQGKYWQAIESIKKDIPFLEEFYSSKNEYGEISIALFANMVNKHNLDLNSYLVRRIVAVELSKFINDAREPKKNTFANNSSRCTTQNLEKQ